MSKRAVKQFRNHLERLGYSKGSVRSLPILLADFLSHQAIKTVQEIAPKNIINYYEHLKVRPHKKQAGGISSSYINTHIYMLKLFLQWQLENGTITENPISGLEFPAPETNQREILNPEEIKAIYEACETFKERAILSLFYGCGLRRSEAEKLNLKDVHFRSNLLYVRKGKGSKRRAVPLSPGVKKDLWNYATKERFNQTDLAFITNTLGKRTRGDNYNKTLKRILQKTTIEKRISLHCLRHSIATHLLEVGLSIEYVRDFLGHQHLETTQIYARVQNRQLWKIQNLKAI
jgi:integrase/recombinase XerD